jgi:hypothetical protein
MSILSSVVRKAASGIAKGYKVSFGAIGIKNPRQALAKLKPSNTAIAAAAFIPGVGVAVAATMKGIQMAAGEAQKYDKQVSSAISKGKALVSPVKTKARATVSALGGNNGGGISSRDNRPGYFVGSQDIRYQQGGEQAYQPEYLQDAGFWGSSISFDW